MNQANITLYLAPFRYQLPLNTEKKLLVGNVANADLLLPQVSNGQAWQFFFEADQWCVQTDKESVPLIDQQELDIDGEQKIQLFLSKNALWEMYDCSNEHEMYVGNEAGCSLRLETSEIQFLLKKAADKWELLSFSKHLYVNNEALVADQIILEAGDEISFGSDTFRVFPNEIHVTSETIVAAKLPQLARSRYGFSREYPDFHRSPRVIYREPEDKLTISTPPQEPTKPTEQLLKTLIPPLIMIMVSVAMAFIRPNGLYVLATVATTLATIIFSVVNFFKTRKEFKIETKARKENYHDYLIKKSIELRQVNETQKKGQLYHYPSIIKIKELVENYSPRIYEKTPLHFDFLYYRLGLGEVHTTTQVDYPNKEREKKGDELEEQGYALYEQNLMIQDMPITANLMNGPVGYIGPRSLVIEQLHLLINQLATFHSYHDLQFISIFPEEEKQSWEWMRWFRHSTLQDMNVRGFVYNQRSRDQVLNSLNQILKNRRNQLDENRNSRESTLFSPHYVVMVTDEKLILDHVIMEFFNEDPSELGCSILFVEDVMSSLSDNVQTVIDIRDRQTGVLVMEQGELRNTPFKLDHFPQAFDKEQIPRTLAGLNHLQNLKSSIPESVTFMELYGVEHFEELNVENRWQEHSPHKSLAVPLGLRGKDDVVYLNLHEKAHGPHGLVAGTTGSGKSEIVQSYIISLAVNFHPYDVAFLLIDYKGGGMANLFRNLPHLLGTITNLDGAQSMRALVSINAELKRRQRLFSENNVNHINQYQKLYKNGDVSQPMPHLFLISDEFAELKAEQPEFMDELVSTARIGRSLGIHLILATQKPSGVVNDQIWSNSKFKLALKVADKQDSMEMLKTPDAAEITQPGRAYLQVGNNEIYELFQSAWSGADYQPDKDNQNIEDYTIYRINELGQYEILSEDLSGLENAEDIQQVPTELEAIVDGIHNVVEQANIAPLPRPWLPPLPEQIHLSNLHQVDFKEAWNKAKTAMKPVIGFVDIPSMQAQETLTVDLSKDGHIAVYASPGYGKSTLIQTVVMDLARTHSPAHLHVYLLDFGTNGLLPLKHLPHVADTMTIDDEEKIGKFIRRIQAEIKRRKKLLSEFSVATLDMYEKASGNEEPIILIPLDGFEGMKNTKFGEALEAMIVSVAREGAGVGIHLILSAGRQNSLRMNLYSNIKVQIPLKLIDDSEARAIVGRTQLVVDDLPGRGLIKLEEPQIFQTALPADGDDVLEIIENMRREASEMDAYWSGERPEEIPMIPEILNFEEFRQKRSVRRAVEKGAVPLGLDFEEVEVFPYIPEYHGNLAVFGEQLKTLQPLKESILSSMELLNQQANTMVIDSGKNFDGESVEVNAYIMNLENMEQVKNDLLTELRNRNVEEISKLPKWFIYITDMESFEKAAKLTEDEFKEFMQEGNRKGLYFILAGDHQYMAKTRIGLARLVKELVKTAVFAMRVSDQMYADKPYMSKEPDLEVDSGYVVADKQFIKIKHPHV